MARSWNEWNWDRGEVRETVFDLPGLVGNNAETISAARMSVRDHHSGSGNEAFGGAKKWPAVKLEVAFQVDEEVYRDQLAGILRAVTEQFLTDLTNLKRKRS